MLAMTHNRAMRSAHFVLAMIGFCLWVYLVIGALLLVGLARLGHWIWPEADMGNCWTFALPRWSLEGGELRITMRRVGRLPVPHAAWCRPDGTLEQTEPVKRATRARDAWRTIYFRFHVQVSKRQSVEGSAP